MTVKVKDIVVGRTFEGRSGEQRKVARIRQHYGALVIVDWVAVKREVKGKPKEGESSPPEFAKWATAIVPDDESQEAEAAGQRPLFRKPRQPRSTSLA